jgi:hypothetical protein
VIPVEARRLARERLETYVAAIRARPQHDKVFADSLEGFGRQITDPDYGAPAGTIRRFWEFTRALDESRGQSLQASCPELFALMTAPDPDASGRAGSATSVA